MFQLSSPVVAPLDFSFISLPQLEGDDQIDSPPESVGPTDSVKGVRKSGKTRVRLNPKRRKALKRRAAAEAKAEEQTRAAEEPLPLTFTPPSSAMMNQHLNLSASSLLPMNPVVTEALIMQRFLDVLHQQNVLQYQQILQQQQQTGPVFSPYLHPTGQQAPGVFWQPVLI